MTKEQENLTEAPEIIEALAEEAHYLHRKLWTLYCEGVEFSDAEHERFALSASRVGAAAEYARRNK